MRWPDASAAMAEAVHRSGLVAILGRPNAGKSTLLNQLLGEKLAIVTAKPQTTRSRILGILTLEGAQLLLLDTPGMHAGTRAFNVALNDQVDEAAADCDVALLLVDPRDGWGDEHAAMLAGLRARGTPVVAVGTKADLPAARNAAWPPAGAEPIQPAGKSNHLEANVSLGWSGRVWLGITVMAWTGVKTSAA